MDKEMLAEAVLGKDAEDFVKSDIGKYIIGCAEQEAQEATNKLKNVYPWRTRKITELQNKIWRAESIQTWLAELIIKGRQAIQQLDIEDE